MHRIRQTVSVLMIAMMVSASFITAQAQRRPYRLTDQQVKIIIRRVETNADKFRSSLDGALDSSRLDGTRREDNINEFIRSFESATDQLRERFNNRNSVVADVQAVLDSATRIDGFLRRNQLNARVESDWSVLRTDLSTLADAYNVRWDWNNRGGMGNSPSNNQRPSRINDAEVERIMRRVETSTERFRASLNIALDRGRLDGTRREDNINEFVRSFDDATRQLRERFNNRTSVAADVQSVLDRAAAIDGFMRRQRLTNRAQNDWTSLKSELNALAGVYNITGDWSNNTSPATGGYEGNVGTGYDAQLTGTYRLDASRSDNPRDVADRATRDLPSGERQRIYDVVAARLESPDMLAIERRGNTVTISSSRAAQTNFEVDGRERSEQLPNARVARVRATFNGDQLVVTSTGYRDNDFTVTFDPIDNGRRLEVTRSIYSGRLEQPVVVRNIYDRTSDVAQWNIYDSSRPSANSNDSASGDFIVRNNETLVATLNNDVSTKQAKDGDPFTMTVRSPAQYEGAVIEGTVSGISRSGKISGRSGLTFNFDRIRLRDGRTHRFAGFVDSVRTTGGETVRVDNEGGVRESDSQTERTVQRAAIGTAVGAIIGAIAGGGKGAAIGAAIGAAGGAGSVYVQGRDDLELLSGTEVTLRASAPNR